jgi:hypothetical protein
MLATCALALSSASPAAIAQVVQSVTILQPSSTYSETAASGAIEGTQVGYGFVGTNSQALVWHGTNTATSLQPASGYSSTQASAISGNIIGGLGQFDGTIPGTTAGNLTALLWTVGSTTPTSLNPTLAGSPAVYSAIAGDAAATNTTPAQEVGYAEDASGGLHAMLWTGTAASAIDLNSNQFNSAQAFGVSAGAQVGQAEGVPTGGQYHAIMWQSSPTNYTDLGAVLGSGYIYSSASGISGNLVVGFAALASGTNQNHAVVWNTSGTPSYTDINPAGFTSSSANAVSNGIVVGDAYNSSGDSNAIWYGVNGTGFLNLQNYLPLDPIGTSYSSSTAEAITPDGMIVGVASYTSGSNTIENAVMWQVAVPSPGALPVLAGGMSLMATALSRRRARVRK